jgi:2,4-dienoyl-CoA reductase-like NADH-dependent reductase (Old Yellow Enzyme family)
MTAISDPLWFPRGPVLKNRLALAPLTNTQSHDDGRLSDEELHWLAMRAAGGFGLTMTCASHVQAVGRGFPGQLGCFGEQHVDGLMRIAHALRAHDSCSILQLHHAGIRAPWSLIGGRPVGPSDDPKTGARALTRGELETLIEDFAQAAVRAERAGFDGVELHGAHGYLLCAFLSPTLNQRTDDFGGPLSQRARILFEILARIRARTGPRFIVGVRLSPERFGMELPEVLTVAQWLVDGGQLDFLDLSLWDYTKEPEAPALRGRTLQSWFMDLDRKGVKLGVAGKLHTRSDVERVLARGADFAVLGRVAILHHDYPARLAADPAFEPLRPPVSEAHLAAEGLSPAFIRYMRTWPGFVSDPPG